VSALRRHLITGEPILFAPERASRIGAFGERDAFRCPFCPGHEDDTPPEIVRIGDPWRMRVVPNRYPPSPGAEVIIESPRHDAAFHDIGHAEEAVGLLLARVAAHADEAYVSAFRNEGPKSGASIPHLHSQVVPLPFLPPRIERELKAFEAAPLCPLCRLRDAHEREDLIIEEGQWFVWLAPIASFMPWQQWIVPKEHLPQLTALNAEAVRELAAMLGKASRRMTAIAPSSTWTFQSFPSDDGHAYVELYPRLTAVAGLELGTGTFVEIIDPAAAARHMRSDAATP
jgi:UDPglucose--hexose-1-phosphate uridylyltransferase